MTFEKGARYSFTPKHDGVKRHFRVLEVSDITGNPTVWYYEEKMMLVNVYSRQSYTISDWLEKWMLKDSDCSIADQEV